MGRKKKKQLKPWCWYCNREFDDEKILIQHQKAKHFKCHLCHKKLYTGPGLSIHCMQVHKEKVDKVPNALPGRNDIEIEIYGMEGIPEDDLKEHEMNKSSKEDPPPAKKAKPDEVPPAGASNALGSSMQSVPLPPSSLPPSTGPMPPMGPMGMPMAGPMGHMGMPMGHMGGMPPAIGPMAPMPPMGPMGPMMPPGPMPPRGPLRPGIPSTSIPTSVQSGPTKPLFPAASNVTKSVSATSAPLGPDFKPKVHVSGASSGIGPMKPTFPAYSTSSGPVSYASPASTSSATISAAPTVKKPESSSGMSIKLVHPDEDISLEERRASMRKYKGAMGGGMGMASMPSVSRAPPMVSRAPPMVSRAPPMVSRAPPMQPPPMISRPGPTHMGIPPGQVTRTSIQGMPMAPGGPPPVGYGMMGPPMMPQGGRY